MHESYLRLIRDQYDATFSMLKDCISECEDSFWLKPVVNLTFDQVAFHALFFTDLYLQNSKKDCIEEQRGQSFHLENKTYFRDYEELANRVQTLHYDRAKTVDYLLFCREKAKHVLTEETIETLEAKCAISWLDMSRAELYVYNLKHLHHHVAQLSLKLRMNQGEGADWVNSGWKPSS